MAWLSLLVSGVAAAVPCGPWETTGGVLQSSACRDGSAGDANDSAADLNGGRYFGQNNWQQLARTSDDADGSGYWEVGHEVGQRGASGYMGVFWLAPDLWDVFDELVVVLADGGSIHDPAIKWSAYLLNPGDYGTFNWSYDGGFTVISHLTLYGRLRTVAEPQSLALVATGLVAFSLLLARRRQLLHTR
jgi:hypothetical protein